MRIIQWHMISTEPNIFFEALVSIALALPDSSERFPISVLLFAVYSTL